MSLDQISFLSPEDRQRILDGPALEPPTGIIPAFDSPPNQNPAVCAGLVTCLVLTTIAVLIRVYSRLFCIKKVELEDYFAFAAYGVYCGYIHVVFWMVRTIGGYVHQWDVRVRDLSAGLYIIYIGSIVYQVTMMIMKACILKEWARIFVPHGTRNKFYWTCHVLICLNILYYTATVIASNFACIPREKIWDKTIAGGHCGPSKATEVSAAAINLVTDVFILLLPQKIIWWLQMSRMKKLGISLLFTLGTITCVCASFRMEATVRYYHSDDATYTISRVTMWSLGEMTCTFLVFCVACVPSAVAGLRSSRLAALIFGLRASRQTGNSRSWPSASPGTSSNSRRAYGRTGLGGKSVPLTDFSVDVAVSESTEQLHEGLGPAETGIIRKTTFTAKEEFVVDGGIGGSEHNRHNVWDRSY